MTRRLLFIIGLLSTTFCFGQIQRENALLVAEYKKNSETGNYAYLVSYNFTNGKLISKDTIFSAPTNMVRYDLGNNFVYKNRYVISGIGNVIDIQTKSLIMDESDKLIETRGDSIIFHGNNIYTENGYFICNLKKRTYEIVKDKNFLSVKGLNSPNHLWGIQVDMSNFPYKIILYNKNNKPRIIVDNCSGTLLSIYASTLSDVPIYWIDNNYFIYADYKSIGKYNENIKATVTMKSS